MTLSERKLIEILQSDLRTLSNETKRKYQPVKEAAEAAIMKIKTNSLLKNIDQIDPQTKHKQVAAELQSFCSDLLQPFLMGCDTKSVAVIQLCLTSIQRLINYQVINCESAVNVIQMLWQIYDQEMDEIYLRLLQTCLILLTSNQAMVTGKNLAHAIVLCFRLHFTKNEVVNNTAEATIRQVVALVFDRVVAEDKEMEVPDCSNTVYIPKSGADKFALPPNLTKKVGDAYQLFQDLCQLVNADGPQWLVGIAEMTRTFGLELLETVLNNYQSIFTKHAEFRFLLKDKVCALVICLFSPNIKHRQGAPPPPTSSTSLGVQEKPYFPISMRLLRVVSTLLTYYYDFLVTESEIFLSLLIKFLETDKPEWQRALAVEVLQQLCIQPKLLRSFCSAYDMQKHSTKIYKNLVNALGTFIQNMFVSESSNTNSSSFDGALSSNQTTAHTFEYKGNFIPVMPVETHRGGIKYMYREMLEKVEPPSVPAGYVLGMAFNSFLDLIRGLTSMIDSDLADIKSKQKKNETLSDDQIKLKSVYEQMLDATWCTMLSVLALLQYSSTDESTTASILKCLESCAAVCGVLKLTTPRDAFITVLCKSALPVQYALPIFNATLACIPQKIAISFDQQQILNNGFQQEIVVTGVPLNTANGAVMLTAKNIQCMRTVISLSHCHGAVMNTAWQIILTTLQHLVWILGLKPTAGGKLILNKNKDVNSMNTVITNAVMTDLPELATTLTTLFESSKHLDDVELHHLVNALCSLSLEAMDKAYNTNIKEPSLFAVAKLLETGLINMFRIDILWRPVSGHLLEVCQHPNQTLRKWGSEGVTTLVKEVLNYSHKISLVENPRMLHMFLLPLKEMSDVQYDDIRQKQLDSTLQILHNSGDLLKSGWPELLHIVGSATNTQSENMIRSGFRCLQLIISDFLQFLSVSSLKLCIDDVSRYGKQNIDLNISLTAIGLLWSVSDFTFQNWKKFGSSSTPSLTKDEHTDIDDDSSSDPFSLWILLFSNIGELCVDERPSVRKSAGQTLFQTISTHGGILNNIAWNKVIWDVLFVLMDNVQHNFKTASKERDVGNILIHHSRDTAEKQWQETLVLTLAGLSRVFKLKHGILSSLQNFQEAWEKLFSYLEEAAICSSSEVSGAAMFSLEDVLLAKVDSNMHDEKKLWYKAWDTWCSIGIKVTVPPLPDITDIDNVISQAYITSFLQLFPIIHKHILPSFTVDCFRRLCKVMDGALKIPIRSDSEAFIFPMHKKFGLTPLQGAIVKAIDIVQKGISTQSGNEIYPEIFKYLLQNVEYSNSPPKYGNLTDNKVNKNGKPKWICVNCNSFAEYCIGLTVELYKKIACDKNVIKQSVLTAIIKTLSKPLSQKYSDVANTTWEYAIEALLLVLSTGLPVVRQHSETNIFKELWPVLYTTLNEFLFPCNNMPTTLSVEEQKRQEDLDIKVIELFQTEILPYSSGMPKNFISNIVSILNKGSGHESLDKYTGAIDKQRRRDRLSNKCFQTLLQFSQGTVNGNSSTKDPLPVIPKVASEINSLTIKSLIQRCSKLLKQYTQESRLSLNFPLQEDKVHAVITSLQAMDNLLTTLYSNKTTVDSDIWKEICGLYPLLVESISCSSTELRVLVARILLHYQPLIKTPT